MMQHLAWRAPPLIARLLQSSFLAMAPKLLPWPRFHCSCSPVMLHRIICLRHVQPVNTNATITVDDVGESVAEQTVAGLSTQLDCRQQLQCGEWSRSLPSVCGAGAEVVFAITLLKSPWPIYPSLPVLSCSRGRSSSGQIRCSSYSSVWKGSSPISKASVDPGDTRTIEELWELYFADASQWWDNRVDKKNPRSPDFKHKVTRKGLSVDSWSTPAWVKARLKSVTQGRLQCHAGYGTRDPQYTAQGRRLFKGNDGKQIASSTSARELRKIAQDGRGSMQMQSASTTTEAISMLRNCLQRGTTVNSDMYVEVLKRCLKQKDGIEVKQVHDCIIKSGMDQNTYVVNNLVSVYIRCGQLQDAHRVFDGLLKKNVVSWNTMIGGYAQHSHAKVAMGVFHQMLQEGVQPNAITFLSILKGCASAGALEWVKEVHSHALEAGFGLDVRVGSALVHMYSKSGSIEDARLVFDRMEERDVVTWTTMIGAYAESGCGDKAYRLFLQMKQEGFKPNAITYMSILNACASAGALEWVKEVHSHALEAGFESDVRVGNALVHMYAKSGSIEDARLVFDRMAERDSITWTTIIGAYAESGCGEEAYRLFHQMKREGIKPDAITYMNILNACASVGSLERLKEVHSHALEAGLDLDLRVGNALVHMYAKSGSIEDARLVFDRMEERDVISWNTMIAGLADHGRGHEALEFFKRIDANGLQPDASSFVSVLSACSHAGLVDEGRRLFFAMSHDYGIEPTVIHYNCMVDLLSRGGHLEEAKHFIDNMTVEPNESTWGALLGACRIYGNIELGELAANEVFKLQPKNASPYILLSNIYASAGKWEEVSLVRRMMEERGLRKEAGRSWIEVHDKIHYFVADDLSHPEAKGIYTELKRLTELIKVEGYIPDTRLVLKNIEEEDKEQALCFHSEKLAIAYGLMHVPRGQLLRVYKNLRVCSDCHTATKFISKVTGREIVARDANRFHHFKDGICSCGDYW